MQHIAPAGPIYQAGTLSGNPVAMAAGLAHAGANTGSGFLYASEQRRRSPCVPVCNKQPARQALQ